VEPYNHSSNTPSWYGAQKRKAQGQLYLTPPSNELTAHQDQIETVNLNTMIPNCSVCVAFTPICHTLWMALVMDHIQPMVH